VGRPLSFLQNDPPSQGDLKGPGDKRFYKVIEFSG
jgi:hypothetical protein